MGVDGARGGLVELGERERSAQFEAARALPPRDRDGGQKRFFRGRAVGAVATQQDFAARPMQFGFECAMAHAIGSRQRFVEDGYGAACIARLGLGFRQGNLYETIKNQDEWVSPSLPLRDVVRLSGGHHSTPGRWT